MSFFLVLFSLVGCEDKSSLDTAALDTAWIPSGDDTGPVGGVDDSGGGTRDSGTGGEDTGGPGGGDTGGPGGGDTGGADTGGAAVDSGPGGGVDTGETGDKEDAPAVTWLSPLGGEYLYGTWDLRVDAVDDVLVVWVEYYVDGALLDYDIDGEPWEIPWPSDDFSEGAHTLTAIAYDDVSASGEASVEVIVDRSPPEVTVTAPADGEEVSGTIAVEASVVEDNLKDVAFWVDGSLVATFGPGDALSWSWDTSGLPTGSYPVEVIATDRAGWTGSDTVAVSVISAPEVIITAPGDGDTVSGEVVLTAEAADDGSVLGLDFLLDGTIHDSLSGSSPYSSTWDTCAASPGPVAIVAEAVDDEGLTGSDSITVTVDQPFEIALVGPAGDLEPSELLQASLYDDVSITDVTWDLDGTPLASTAAAGSLPGDLSCAYTCGCYYYEELGDFSGFSSGSYTLRVTATNADGEVAVDTVAVRIDADGDGDGFDSVDWGGDDCDDGDAAINPDAAELCDGVDNNCDGATDGPDAADAGDWFADDDGDGFGDAGEVLTACEVPPGYVDIDGDCDDGDAAINPDAAEVCDGIDNDCDGLIDDDDPDVDLSTGTDWYVDGDGDGFGDPGVPAVLTCAAPPGSYTADGTDCDDGDAAINPGAVDVCDGIDNDCDAATGEDGVVTLDGENYLSVQGALNAAYDGAVLTICDGTYVEALTVRNDVTLESLNGAGAVTINAAGGGSVIDVEPGNDLIVEGLTLSGGSGTYDPGVGGTLGGGINAYTADSLTLRRSIVEDNTATLGGGILGSGYASDFIEDTVIRNNVATNTGGGLFAFGADFEAVEVSGNEADYGGGAYFYGDTVTLDADSIIAENTALIGGGLWVDEADLVMDPAATISGNRAEVSGGGTGGGGGIYLQGGTLSGGIVSGNVAEDYGGGIFAESAAAVDAVVIEDNRADYGGGGILFIDSNITANDLEISGNEALFGGGVWAESTATELRDAVVSDNLASYGGGLLVYRSTDVTLRSSVISDNAAGVEGGGVFLVGLWNAAGSTLLEDASITSTTSDWGTGAADNAPEDVWVDYWDDPYSYGSSASFTCTMSLGGCF